ncbi:hypothetical protein D0T53_07045 [Dysgonomonas sp. 216]|uniref:hypothetical protein n=1 Tax=Dysgonomonas sp. 216 TaxID=2302934 RepID=UPI0013D7226C|nr:hypothetical protein [Dysgonomonas sp. 216]NDW18302.1 hypothetical protein [Dysgonomonas sp. 216]NDW18670.1 hypothetical protein [Dysgonomonas sp. 216]
MKTNNFLLPACFRKIGWIISLPLAAILIFYLLGYFDYSEASTTWNFFDGMFNNSSGRVLNLIAGKLILSVCMILLVIGLLFIAFSKEKIEDEYIAKLRGDSLIWSVIVNSVLLIVTFLFVYGDGFIFVLFLNLYALLILFIIKYNIALRNFKKSNDYEE